MILYAGSVAASDLSEAFSARTVASVETVPAARARVADADAPVLFVDSREVDAPAFAREVRSEVDDAVAVVGIGDGESDVFDASVAPGSEPEAYRAAADRARRVLAYRDAVGEFLDRSRERGGDESLDAVRPARDDADERFADLPPLDESTIAALFRGEESDEAGAGGRADVPESEN